MLEARRGISLTRNRSTLLCSGAAEAIRAQEPRGHLPSFVDLLLTWVADMQKPRDETRRMLLISFKNLVAGVGFEPTTFRL